MLFPADIRNSDADNRRKSDALLRRFNQNTEDRGIQVTYQSPGASTSSSSQGGTLLHTSFENENDCSPPRQRQRNVLVEQRGRDKVCISAQTDSQVLSKSLHNINPVLLGVANLGQVSR